MKNEPGLAEVEKEVGRLLSPSYARAESASRDEPTPPATERPVVGVVGGTTTVGLPHVDDSPSLEPPHLTITEHLLMLEVNNIELKQLLTERCDAIEAKLDALLTILR